MKVNVPDPLIIIVHIAIIALGAVGVIFKDVILEKGIWVGVILYGVYLLRKELNGRD